MSKRCWLWRLVVMALLAGAFYAVRAPALTAVARWLDVGDPWQRADYLLVLGGDPNVRPFVAAALVKKGFARQVLLPTTVASPLSAEGLVPPYHEVEQQILRRRGLSESQIFLLPEETSHTFGEIERLDRFLDDKPRARVGIVTSFYHTRRARLAVKEILESRASQVCYVSAPVDGVESGNWWRTRIGVNTIVPEIVKLLAYWIWYCEGWCWVAIGGVLAIAVAAVLPRKRRAATR